MPFVLPHASPAVTRDLRENLDALRALERRGEIGPDALQREITRQLDVFRTNKQAPRGCFGTRKYAGETSMGLATRKLQSRGGSDSAGVVSWVQARTGRSSTPLCDVIGRVTRTHGYGDREFEMRLAEPARLLGGYIGGEDDGRVSCRQAYARLQGQRWASSCGQTSDVLKAVISDHWVSGPALGSKPGREVVQDLTAALRSPANTHVRVQIGCHSFMIENSGPNCRIYQSYMAMGYDGYGLADSLATDQPIPRAEFLRLLERVFNPRTNHDASVRLFRGTCDPTANARRGDICVQFETTSRPRTASQLEAAFDRQLGVNRAEWDAVRRSNEPASQYAMRNLV